jgi:hypothetical protein
MFGLFKSPKRRMLDRSEKMFPIMLNWIRGLPDAGVGLLLDGALTMKDAGMRDDSTGFGAVFYRKIAGTGTVLAEDWGDLGTYASCLDFVSCFDPALGTMVRVCVRSQE